MKTFYRGYYITRYRSGGFLVLTAGLKSTGYWAVNLDRAKRGIDEWLTNGGSESYLGPVL